MFAFNSADFYSHFLFLPFLLFSIVKKSPKELGHSCMTQLRRRLGSVRTSSLRARTDQFSWECPSRCLDGHPPVCGFYSHDAVTASRLRRPM